jgi:hypothetical protein
MVPPARFQRATFRLGVGLRRVYAGSPRFVGVSKLLYSLLFNSVTSSLLFAADF